MLFNGKQGVKKEMKSSLKNKSTAKEGNAFGSIYPRSGERKRKNDTQDEMETINLEETQQDKKFTILMLFP